MHRSEFLKICSSLLLAPLGMNLQTLKKWADNQPATAKMPVLFVGHGNPMNAILNNEFHRRWQRLGKELPRPKAILSVSAHWLTRGTFVTAMEMPKTIHDFGGFPKELFDQQYPAQGAPDLAKEVKGMIKTTTVQEDYEWGLDHGTWSVLKPMYPDADIPVFQLSLDFYKGPQYHYDLAKQLKELRHKGVLILGSGNIVHNLRMVDFSNRTHFDWATEFDQQIKKLVEDRNHSSIINYEKLGSAARLSVPTNDHYLPLLYPLALQDDKDEVHFFNEAMDAGSISMRSILIS